MTVCNGFRLNFFLLSIADDCLRHDTAGSHGFIPGEFPILVYFSVDPSDLGAHHAPSARGHFQLVDRIRRRIVHHCDISWSSRGVRRGGLGRWQTICLNHLLRRCQRYDRARSIAEDSLRRLDQSGTTCSIHVHSIPCSSLLTNLLMSCCSCAEAAGSCSREIVE